MSILKARYAALLVSINSTGSGCVAIAQTPADFGVKADELLYGSAMDSKKSVKDWVMEGPGRVTFPDGWMTMASPAEKMHHVFWCPKTFPESFVAQWEMQNRDPDAGLCIVFFAATGLKGEDVMDPSLPDAMGNSASTTTRH